MRAAALLVALVLVDAPGMGAGPSAEALRELKSPAGSGSSAPSLRAGADGRVYLSWVEPGSARKHALRFAVLDGDRWSAPFEVAAGDDWFVNWADFPSVVATGGRELAAHWLEKNGTGTFAYSVMVRRSSDTGRTWGAPVVPHKDATQTEHGFVSLVPWERDRTAAVWLDGRNFAKKEGEAGYEDMTLRFATIDLRGRVADEAILDDRVCECCQTSAARTSEGIVVVYRDRSPDEVRDIGVVRLVRGRWTKPALVHADRWKIAGCPVNGPSVAADGRRVAVAWYTGAAGASRVRVAFSDDAGATFAEPAQVDGGAPVGRVDVALLDEGSALVCWLERVEGGAEIRARRVSRDNGLGSVVTVTKTSAERASGFPQMELAGDRVVFAWTAPGTPSVVRTAVIPVSEFWRKGFAAGPRSNASHRPSRASTARRDRSTRS